MVKKNLMILFASFAVLLAVGQHDINTSYTEMTNSSIVTMHEMQMEGPPDDIPVVL